MGDNKNCVELSSKAAAGAAACSARDENGNPGVHAAAAAEGAIGGGACNPPSTDAGNNRAGGENKWLDCVDPVTLAEVRASCRLEVNTGAGDSKAEMSWAAAAVV